MPSERHLVDERIDRIVANQHGNITPSQIVACGGTYDLVAHRVGTGALVRDVNGVLRARSHAVSWHQRLHARVLAAGPDAVASHRAAACLHGIDGYLPGRLDVLAPHDVTPLVRRVVLHRTRLLPPGHITAIAGIPTTVVGRTLVDLGQLVDDDHVQQAVDDVRRQGLVTIDHLWGWVYRTAERGRRGPPVLRRVLLGQPEGERPPDSVFNREVSQLLTRAGIDAPVHEHDVVGPDGRFVARLDLAWPRCRAALEPAGMRVHAGDPRVVAADIERRAEVVALGWTLMECTWSTYDRTPGRLIDRVRSMLAAAAH